MSNLERYQRKSIKLNYDEIKDAINSSTSTTGIYIGCDSQRVGKTESGFPYIRVYVTCVIIHHDGNKGASIYKSVDFRQDFDNLRLTLSDEAGDAINVAVELQEAIGDRPFEIHLDINPDPRFKSSAVVKEAMGYVYGMLGIKAKIKPEAFAASTAADHFAKQRKFKRI